MRVNVEGTNNLTRACFARLRRSGAGADPKVVVVASEISYAGVSAAMNAPHVTPFVTPFYSLIVAV